MGNKIDAKTRIKNLEDKILSSTGLILHDDIHVSDVPIGDDNFIHTIRCGLKNKDVLVLVHGYASCGIIFLRILKELSEKYQVYCIDILGMGMSSRPTFDCTNAEESINFFNEGIEKWRIAVGLDQFVFAGHSLGGHLVCHYAHKYPKVVTKLFLISPLGFTNYKDGRPRAPKQTPNFFMRTLIRWKDNIFANKITMSHITNNKTCVTLFLKYGSRRRFKQFSEVGDKVGEYLVETYKFPESFEKAVFLLVNSEFEANSPLEEIVEEMNDIPIIVLFGEKDWMDTFGAKRLANKTQKQNNYELYFIKDAGHQISMENPQGLLEHMLKEDRVS
jgi:abhydrolase domain-containing protein 5